MMATRQNQMVAMGVLFFGWRRCELGVAAAAWFGCKQIKSSREMRREWNGAARRYFSCRGFSRDLQRFSSNSKFKDNVNGAQLKLAATNSETTPTAARFGEPEPAATLRSRTAGSQGDSPCRASHKSKSDVKGNSNAESRRDAGATMRRLPR